MKLIAKKPCSFGGKQFYIGNEIPVDLVLNPQEQEKMGRLAIVSDAAVSTPPAETPAENQVPVDTMTVVIHAEKGDLPLSLTAEGLQAVVDVLTSTVDDAEPIINQMVDDDALILLHAADYRKGIKEAAAARAQALTEEKSNAGQQDPGDTEGQQDPDGTAPAGQQDPEDKEGEQ